MRLKRTVGSKRLRLGEWLPVVGALVWSVVLLDFASTAQVYVSSSVDSTGPNTSLGDPSRSSTLIEENGSGVLWVVGVPLLMTILVGLALWIRGSRRGAGLLAWTLTGLLVGFNLLAMLTIGPVVIPVTVCLAVACFRRQTRESSPVATA